MTIEENNALQVALMSASKLADEIAKQTLSRDVVRLEVAISRYDEFLADQVSPRPDHFKFYTQMISAKSRLLRQLGVDGLREVVIKPLDLSDEE